MILRRRRVFARLREGWGYDEIAEEEGVGRDRIRQIVSDVLKKRAVDSGAEHAKLQLERLAPAVQLGAEAIAAGDVSAIGPYLKAIDRLDRYQVVASANQAYDDDARQKLMDKINRVVDNLRAKEARADAAGDPSEAIDEIPADERGGGSPGGSGRGAAGRPERGCSMDVHLRPARNLKGEWRDEPNFFIFSLITH